jgi:hypothetical protein
MKLASFRKIFAKYSNIKFHENPYSGSRVLPRRPTDSQTEIYDKAKSRFSQFCKRAWKCINKSHQNILKMSTNRGQLIHADRRMTEGRPWAQFTSTWAWSDHKTNGLIMPHFHSLIRYERRGLSHSRNDIAYGDIKPKIQWGNHKSKSQYYRFCNWVTKSNFPRKWSIKFP